MSGKTKMGFGRGRSEVVAEASEVSDTEAGAGTATAARVIGPRKPVDPLQEARDLEDAAMAYSEVVRAIGALTKTTQAGEDTYAGLSLAEMSANLDAAWKRWDNAQRRLIGQQRSS